MGCELRSIVVHVYGVPNGKVIVCKLQKDKQLLDQLNQTTKKHLQCDQPSESFFTFMYKGINLHQTEKLTPDALKMKSKDHILAISPGLYNCLDTNPDVDDLDILHVKVLVISMERKVYGIMTRQNRDCTAKYLKQQFKEELSFGGTKDERSLSVVHNGFILEDEDTFYGAGVCEGDAIALIDLGGLKDDTQLEKLIILNSKNSRSLLNLHNSVQVGIPGGVRILHNLDPDNPESHSNKHSASACKSLLRSVKSELVKDLEDFFLKIRNQDLSIYFDEQMVIRLEGPNRHVHATDLLSDISETLLMIRIKCKIEKSLWKEIVTKVLSFVQRSDLSRISCCQDYEPFKNCAVSVLENFPLFSDLTVDSDCSSAFLQETVLFIGPKRDGKSRPDFPIIKLRAFTTRTTIQDLINSYKVYTSFANLQIDCLTFNNKVAEPTELVTQVLGGMFEKNYLGFSVLVPERLDSLVEFIEGRKEEKVIQKKKKKKRVKLVNYIENPIEDKNHAAVERAQGEEIDVDSSEKTSSPPVKLEQTLKFGEETENNISEIESEPIYDKLKLALGNKEALKNENKLNLQQMIEVKSREMKILLVKISGIEDENCMKDKRITSIDAEINDLEARVAILKKEKMVIDEEKDVARNHLKKYDVKKLKLEKYIEVEMLKAKEKELELEMEIGEIREELTALEKNDSSKLRENTESIDQDPMQKLLDFLTISISERKKDLECPVCLETASVPIYSCQENHLICSSCRPMVKLCPECRMEYGDEKGLRRHRYAEKTVRELDRLREERRKIME